ncbi:MAG: disulfide bond formation protein B [Burkholderiaceae bacterium]|nr:disulfide bond formation protein B [Burkholderiaceae bacterium]
MRFLSLSARAALAAVAAFAVVAMAVALYLQYGLDLKPCPLCVMQRIACILAGAIALVGALLARRRGVQMMFLGASLLPALAGAGVAVWHVWILAFPPESMTCGRPFEWFHADFPLAVWLPRLFRGDGDCLSTEWSLLGMGIPHWSLVGFVVVLALLLAGLRAAARSR